MLPMPETADGGGPWAIGSTLGEEPRLAGQVLVVGGGSTAMDAARSALRSGAEHVTVVYRRRRADMPAQAEEIEAAEREGIAIRPLLTIDEVIVRDGGAVGLRCRPADGGEAEPGINLRGRTILIASGEEPDPSILPEGTGIEVSGWAGVVADARTLSTGETGVFAGGDVVSGPKTIIDAVAAGRRAAGSIHTYLSGTADGEAAILRVVRYATEREPELTVDLSRQPRRHPPLPVVDPRSFAPTQGAFTSEDARSEASRCFRCDAVYGCETVHVVAGRGPADRPAMTAPPGSAAVPLVATVPPPNPPSPTGGVQ
jgi:pyruvate/2-oxoglutarate dehydrogenase complex dihydrolipoamide dehydrogenase (E3) component